MNYNFYASKADKLALLHYLFTATDLHLYDHYSVPGEEVREYTSADEVAQAHDLHAGSSYAAAFKLWAPRFGAAPEFIRVALDPRYCQENTFRYRTGGWGLIQLHFGGEQNSSLAYSHLGHFNEKGAVAREVGGLPATHQVAQWNWGEINATSRALRYLLHSKWSAAKLGSMGVLPGAAESEQQGIQLVR